MEKLTERECYLIVWSVYSRLNLLNEIIESFEGEPIEKNFIDLKDEYIELLKKLKKEV